MMQKEIIDRLCNLYDQYGNEIYADAKKLKGFLSDILYDFPKERKRIGIILTEDILSKITDSTINTLRLQSISQNVSDIFSMESSVVSEIIFSFAYIIHRKEEYLNYASIDSIVERMDAAFNAEDDKTAFSLAQIGANQGIEKCIGMLGLMYRYGWGTEIDLNKSYDYLSKSTQPRAYYELGFFYLDGEVVEQNVSKALELFEKGAEMGYSYAFNTLGSIYTIGKYIERDFCKAFQYYSKAADAGIVESYANLGFSYLDGTGTDRDIAKAIHYFEKSIDENVALGLSHEMLGKCYSESGNLELSKEYYKKAITIYEESNDENIMICLDKYYGIMLNEYMPLVIENKLTETINNEMRELVFKGAEYNLANIQGFLGVAYRNGVMFVEKNEEKELYWFTKSAENGWAESQYQLYTYYSSKHDIKTALNWLAKAVEQHHETSIGALIHLVISSNELSDLTQYALQYSISFLDCNKDWSEPSKYPLFKLQMARLVSKNRDKVKLLSSGWNDKLIDDMIQAFVTHAHESEFKSMVTDYFENVNGIWRLK